jgi:hypothetical protein
MFASQLQKGRTQPLDACQQQTVVENHLPEIWERLKRGSGERYMDGGRLEEEADEKGDEEEEKKRKKKKRQASPFTLLFNIFFFSCVFLFSLLSATLMFHRVRQPSRVNDRCMMIIPV